MPIQNEQDFPPGHPARGDYDANSAEAKEWHRAHHAPNGERDWPVDHPKAVDSKGNLNHLEWGAGVNPQRPDLQPHTGRTPAQVKALEELNAVRGATAKATVPPNPIEAPPPPPPGSIQPPSGQPGDK